MKFEKKYFNIIFISAIIAFFSAAYIFDFQRGQTIALLSADFFLEVLPVLPVIFLLIGLFEIFIKRSVIIRHLGPDTSNIVVKYTFAVILASLNVGGMALAFPVAYALKKKGADMKVVFTYLGAAGLVRINMILFEATFLGLKFTLLRLFTAIPLIIFAAVILNKYFNGHTEFSEKGEC